MRPFVKILWPVVISADRKRKHVIVDGSFVVPYDHLILCTGLQYQVPKPTGLDVNAGATNNDVDHPERPQPRMLVSVPKNVFVVNDAYDAAVVLYWLEDNVLNMAGACILLTALSCALRCSLRELSDIFFRSENYWHARLRPPFIMCYNLTITTIKWYSNLKIIEVDTHFLDHFCHTVKQLADCCRCGKSCCVWFKCGCLLLRANSATSWFTWKSDCHCWTTSDMSGQLSIYLLLLLTCLEKILWYADAG